MATFIYACSQRQRTHSARTNLYVKTPGKISHWRLVEPVKASYRPRHWSSMLSLPVVCESYAHILTQCRATADVPDLLNPELVNAVQHVEPTCNISNFLTDEMLTQFIINPSSMKLQNLYSAPKTPWSVQYLSRLVLCSFFRKKKNAEESALVLVFSNHTAIRLSNFYGLSVYLSFCVEWSLLSPVIGHYD